MDGLIYAFLFMLVCGTGGGLIAGLALGMWLERDLHDCRLDGPRAER